MKDGMPDFVKLAESYGIKACRIKTPQDFIDIENEIVSTRQALLIDFEVNETENCYPMVAPGKSNSQMIGLSSESVQTNTGKKTFS